MNNAVGPIFNIFFLNKVAVGPMNSAATIVNSKFLSPWNAWMKKEKRKKKRGKLWNENADAESKSTLSKKFLVSAK